MKPAQSFEERSECLLLDMKEERMGCPIAWTVARSERVATALISDNQQVHDALEGICSRTKYDALLLLPDEEPDNWNEGNILTEQMSWRVLQELTLRAHRQYEERIPALIEALDEHTGMMSMFTYGDTPKQVFDTYSLMASPVKNTTFSNAKVLEFWNGTKIDYLFNIVHAPYFQGETNKKHPRSSKHYCFVATRMSDITDLPEERRFDIKMWTLSQGNGRYQQKMHPSPNLPLVNGR